MTQRVRARTQIIARCRCRRIRTTTSTAIIVVHIVLIAALDHLQVTEEDLLIAQRVLYRARQVQLLHLVLILEIGLERQVQSIVTNGITQ